MFRKIVSNLNFSPGAASQLTYYIRRLQGESFTRRLSAILAVGVFVLQLLTIAAPPAAANTVSTNDIVYGGLNHTDPRSDILSIYDQDHDANGDTGFQALFGYFGITRAELAGTTVTTISATDHTLNSLGRQRHLPSDTPLVIGGQTYYLRPLSDWGATSTYQVLTGTRGDGSFFAVMLNCGNIVVRTISVAPPALSIIKTTLTGYPVNGGTVAAGSNLGYRLLFANSGAGTASVVEVDDRLPDHTTLVWQGGGVTAQGYTRDPVPGLAGSFPHSWWKETTIPPHTSGYFVDMIVHVDATAPAGTQICNVGYIRSTEIPVKRSNEICQTVAKTPPPPVIPPPKTPNITQTKTAKNLTRGGDANNTTAQAGDVIAYSLLTKNTGNGAQANYTVTEDLRDVLEYADVTQANGALITGGSLSWPAQTIAAGTTDTKTFQVRIKNPIPSTPRSTSDPQSFDLTMDNVYGNHIQIHLPTPPAKTVELAATSLPQTGGASSSLIVLAFFAVVVYFYSRNRQLVKELRMLRVDNAGS